MPDDKPDGYRVRELSERYSIPPQTIYAWIRRGQLRAHRIYGVVIVPASEVERMFGGVK